MIEGRNLSKRLLIVLGAVFVFGLLWSAPRFWLFQDAAMMHDDYFMAAYDNVYDVFFIKEYRILGGVFPMLCKWIFPGFYGTNVPIFLNALLIGGISLLLYQMLIALKCRKLIAFITTVIFCWHPIIDDISAWNTMGFALTSAILVMAGFFFGWRGTKQGVAWATVCITSVLATYQLMMPLPMCMTIMIFVHKGVVQQTWEWKRALSVAGAMALATAIYLVYVVVLSPIIFGPYDGVGIKSLAEVFANWNGLVSQTTNLYLNLFYTPFSFYAGVKPGLSLWYYAPMAIAGLGAVGITLGLYQKKIKPLFAPLLLGCWLALPFLAIAPLWFIPLYTEWRISFIVLISQVIVIGSIAATLQELTFCKTDVKSENAKGTWLQKPVRYGLPIAIVAIALLLVPVTMADCKMRLDDYRHDLAIVDSIRAFRTSLQGGGDDHRVVYVEDDRSVLSLTGDERSLMKANYVINTYSTFSYGRIWAYAMFRWYGLDSITEEELVDVKLPDKPGAVDERIVRFTDLPYVEHYPDQKLSIVVGSPQWFTWTVAQ